MPETIQESIKRANRNRSLPPKKSKPGELSPDKKNEPAKQVTTYNCDFCEDRKRVGYNVEPGHPLFGLTVPCPKCNQAGIAAVSGLYPEERSITLADLDATDRPMTQRMIGFAERFIQHPQGFLSLHGEYGTGKSVALMAIVNACLEKGIEARYLTGHTLMDYLYEAFDPKVMETDRARINRLATIPVLVIDEFEKAKDSPYSADMQFHLIDQRYRNRLSLGTLFAWNGPLEALPWPAVRSRLSEFPVILNNDPDLRPRLGRMKYAE